MAAFARKSLAILIAAVCCVPAYFSFLEGRKAAGSREGMAAFFRVRRGVVASILSLKGEINSRVTEKVRPGLPYQLKVIEIVAEGSRASFAHSITRISRKPARDWRRAVEFMPELKAVKSWFGPVFLEAYLRHKRSEVQHVAEWAVNEMCNRYLEVY